MTLPAAPLVPYHLIGVGRFLGWDLSLGDELTPAQLKTVNTENNSAVSVSGVNFGAIPFGSRLVVLVPEFELVAAIAAIRSEGFAGTTPQYSLDTTNGVDGSWSNIPGTFSLGLTAASQFRAGIVQVDPPIVGVRGVRWGTTGNGINQNAYRVCHIYGFWNEPDHRLELWHPTLDERLTSLDAGILQRDVDVHDQDFRIKNTSTTLTANTITVQTDESKIYTPSNPSWHSLSDGGAFDETVEITSLAPEAISGVLTLRREPPDTVEVGYKRAWLRAVAASWTS